MPAIRIILVTDQYPPRLGGVPIVTRRLAQGLAKRGHTVWVLAPSQSSHDCTEQDTGVTVIRFSSLEWPPRSGKRFAYPAAGKLSSLITHLAPDVIHFQSPMTLAHKVQRTILERAAPIPMIATHHYLPENLNFSLATNSLFRKAFYTAINRFYCHCRLVTGPSRFAVDLLRANGIHAPTAVISNGIDLQAFAPGDVSPSCTFHFRTTYPLILHANRLSPEKCIRVILNALPLMRLPAHLVMVGSGPAYHTLQAQVQSLRLQSRVTFLGRLPETTLLDLRRSSDLAVMASQAELQSLSMMESMACCLPIVAADSGAIPELIHSGCNGLLFPPGNSSALAASLDQLCASPSLRRQMGVRSRAMLIPHDHQRVLSIWEETYQSIIDGLSSGID